MKTLEKFMRSTKKSYVHVCQTVGAMKVAPTPGQVQAVLFVMGAGLLIAGLNHEAVSQITIIGGGAPEWEERDATYNDSQIAQAVRVILTYIEGSFGALVMVGSGIAAILASAFGQYRAALGCLVVAVGAFILRSVMSTFFNLESVEEGSGGI